MTSGAVHVLYACCSESEAGLAAVNKFKVLLLRVRQLIVLLFGHPVCYTLCLMATLIAVH